MVEQQNKAFMDDVSIFGDIFYSCLCNLSLVLKRCKGTNLMLNWEKCHFLVPEGVVSHGIKVDQAKIKVI